MVNFLLQRDNIVAQIWAFVIQFHLLTTKQRWPCWTPVAWAAPMWWCPPWTPVAGTEHNRFLRSCFRSSTHRCFQPPPQPIVLAISPQWVTSRWVTSATPPLPQIPARFNPSCSLHSGLFGKEAGHRPPEERFPPFQHHPQAPDACPSLSTLKWTRKVVVSTFVTLTPMFRKGDQKIQSNYQIFSVFSRNRSNGEDYYKSRSRSMTVSWMERPMTRHCSDP